MSDYRKLFERLAKCNMPAGVMVGAQGEGVFVQIIKRDIRRLRTVGNTQDASDCRAALMLLVDELESTGEWRFSRHRDSKGMVTCALTRCSMRSVPCVASGPAEVTAIAECLIAALGVAE